MLKSKEIQEQMRNKATEIYQSIYQSGNSYKAIFKALGLQRTTGESQYPQW